MAASWKQRVYWKSPAFVKNWLASSIARRWNRERYGPAYQECMAEIAEHDRWTPQQFQDYQNEMLIARVRQAGEHSPYYRAMYRDAGIDLQNFRGLEDLSKLPIAQKQDIRARMEDLVDERLDLGGLLKDRTSGTTGTAITIYRTAELWSKLSAFFDARCRVIAGVSRIVNRSASIGGHLVSAPSAMRPPFWVVNNTWNQLYLSSYHLAPQNLDAYVKALREFAPDYIEGYPSSVYTLARHIVDHGLPPVPMKAVITTAETLFDFHREANRAAFGCRTFNQYGCCEAMVFAAECEAGSLHLSTDYGLVEVVDDNYRVLPPGQTGRLICTSLINDVQPFIRYDLGDLGALSPKLCSCGRVLPSLAFVEGRVDTVLITRDGRRIGRLSPVLKGGAHVAEAQIVQDDFEKFRIRVVPSDGYTDQEGRQLAAALAERIGEADIRVETVHAIERTKSGKFLAVVCNLPAEARAAAGDNAGARSHRA